MSFYGMESVLGGVRSYVKDVCKARQEGIVEENHSQHSRKQTQGKPLAGGYRFLRRILTSCLANHRVMLFS